MYGPVIIKTTPPSTTTTTEPELNNPNKQTNERNDQHESKGGRSTGESDGEPGHGWWGAAVRGKTLLRKSKRRSHLHGRQERPLVRSEHWVMITTILFFFPLLLTAVSAPPYLVSTFLLTSPHPPPPFNISSSPMTWPSPTPPSQSQAGAGSGFGFVRRQPAVGGRQHLHKT